MSEDKGIVDNNMYTENGSTLTPVAANIARRVQLADSMYDLGKSFSEVAKGALASKNVKAAKLALDAAEKAIRLAIDVDDTTTRNTITMADYVFIYLSGISETMLRSAMWQHYQVFCQCYEAMPLPKGKFYDLVEDLGFTFHRTHGEMYAKPPARQPAVLKEAQKKKEFLPYLSHYAVQNDQDQPSE